MPSQQNESEVISAMLERYYFKGIYDGDIDKLNEIYHPRALLFGDVQGKTYFKTLDQYLDAVKNRQSPKESHEPFKGEILNIKLKNSIAIAEVRVRMYHFNYYELLSFHKLDGRWQLVNKMITDTNE